MNPDCLVPTKHRMTRRCQSHNYSARAIYMVTLSLAERKPLLGRLVEDAQGAWQVVPSVLGEKVLACWEKIPVYWEEVELIARQLMPDHFHGILFVKKALPPNKTLGDIVRGFKTGCREVGWEHDYVDSILEREGQLEDLKRYIYDNPRRLGEKQVHRGYFKVVNDTAIDLGEGESGHFASLGNAALARVVPRFYVQCSRRDFGYKHTRLATGNWRVVRDKAGVPLVDFETAAFKEKAVHFLAEVKKGAVLVSPCISHGEKEIIRRAFEIGGRVICLKNKGFARFEKPAGRLFDVCASGRLLLLAPASWEYVPSKKPVSREDALILNTLAQLLVGERVRVEYRGRVPNGLGAMCAKAVKCPALEGLVNRAISGAAPNLLGGSRLGAAAETRQKGLER